MNQELNDILKNIETMLAILIKREADSDTKDEVDIETAAGLVNMTVKTLYTYVNRGKLAIPYVKRGNKLYWKREDVLRWNAERSYKVVRKNGTKMKITL